MAPETVALEVFRYLPDDPDGNQDGFFQTYEVPYRKDWVVLDALNYLKDEVDGTLTYRWSCRMGVCGSCGMVLNGDPRLSCAAFLTEFLPGPIRIEPLTHFPVVRDLVVEMDGFMSKLQSVSPWIIRKKENEKPPSEGEHLQTPAQLARYKQFSMCINCMLCYAACPVMGLEPAFVGPAALALGHRYNLDSRDDGFKDRRAAMFNHEAIWECTFVGECSVVCPKHVDPAAAIQQAKVDATKDWLFSKIMPWRGDR